jgi:hypothetical protein
MSRYLKVRMVFDRLLLPADLRVLADHLVELAPRWSAGARIWMDWDGKRRPLDLAAPGVFEKEVPDAIAHDPTPYQAAVRGGDPGGQRFLGDVEIRGANPSLVAFVGLDTKPVALMADGTLRFGNDIDFVTARARVEGRPVADWAEGTLTRLAGALGPVWGAAWDVDEYDAKVMSKDPSVSYAAGWDLGRYLPGLFWRNFLGAPYVGLLGRDRLLEAPDPAAAREVGDGVMVGLPGRPGDFDTDAYQAAEQAALDWLGREHFYDWAVLGDRPTRAPDWRIDSTPDDAPPD